MKQLILLITFLILVLFTVNNNCNAQTTLFKNVSNHSLTSYRDHSGDLPGMNDNAALTGILIGVGVVAAIVVTYFILQSSSDDKKEEPKSNDSTSSGEGNTSQMLIKEKNSQNQPAVALYIVNQPNFMNSNSTNYALALRLNF